MKKKFESWWIIGLVLPFIGLPIYMLSNKMSKDNKASLKTGTIIGFGIWLFAILSFLINVSNPVKPEERKYVVGDWLIDTEKEEPVVTILGLTTCGHCQSYKPVIEKLADKYGFKLYFFELDELNESDRLLVEKTYKLETYATSVPFTYIVKKGEVIAEDTGFENRNKTLDFLKQHQVIK